MKLFRRKGRTPLETPRFRAGGDVFTFGREGDVRVARVSANGERTVELFHSLTARMGDPLSLSLECLRSRREFLGQDLARVEVREAVARLKVPLVAHAGVEVGVFTDEEQLALSALLELWIYARDDRWLPILMREGLEEVGQLPKRTWTVKRDEFAGAPEMVDAVTEAAERLTLHLVSSRFPPAPR